VIGPENSRSDLGVHPGDRAHAHEGGRGAAYLRMLSDELKPKVDAQLRTLPDRGHTTILGASLGG